MSNKEYRISPQDSAGRRPRADSRWNKDFFAGKKVLVMGLGRFGGGVDVAKFACNCGAKVIITDLASVESLSDSIEQLERFPDIEFHLGSHCAADFEQADIIVANPAVPGDNEFLKLARRLNKFITSQINIFFELCPATVIGVTGTNGKSTTAALTAHLLKAKNVIAKSVSKPALSAAEGKQSQTTQYAIRNTQHERVWLSGNIGNEPLLATIDQISPNDLVVLELSSFQLEQLGQIKKGPKVALLTNLTPNHLDRHGSFADYCTAKENIFKFQELNAPPYPPAVSIFNAEDKIANEWFEKYSKEHSRVCIKFSTDDVSGEIRAQFGLPGRANLSNLAAAIAIAKYFGVTDEQIKTHLPEFKPLPHRLELVAQIDGVSWYNDSISTTPESAIAALEAFEPPVIIIAGGYDKGLAFGQFGEKIARNAKAAILIGRTAEKIAEAIGKKRSTAKNAEIAKKKIKVELADSLRQAVDFAKSIAEAGDVVLLSPGCASYDMFDNFGHRGREFCRLVKEIRHGFTQINTD